jgi:hypothetical protein
MIASNISNLNLLRDEFEKQLINMSVYETYINDISNRAEKFMTEKGIDALKTIGFKYYTHSSSYENNYNKERDYSFALPGYFTIIIDATKIGGQWKENEKFDTSVTKKRDAIVAKMSKDFTEITGQQIQINSYSLEGDTTPIIRILFK